MRKPLRWMSVLVLMSLFLSGCSLTSVTTTTTTTTTSTETSTPTTTTTNINQPILENEFLLLENQLPEGVIADVTLPETSNESIIMYYYLEGVLIDDGVLHYVAYAEDTPLTLTVTLGYNDFTMSKDYTVWMIRDMDLYDQLLRDRAFDDIENLLVDTLPDTITSDFTMPSIPFEGASISYAVDTSQIFNNRFIFTFPLQPTVFTLTATVRYDGETRTMEFPIVMKGLDQLPQIPVIEITTQNNTPITSKEVYVSGSFSLTLYDDDLNETVLLNQVPIQIRGRGNSTFYMPKMSFRVKFDSKTSLVFDHRESDWVLIANFPDQSLLRNYLAYHLAADMNMAFAPGAAFVDVYLNGEYLGNYLLTDQVEVTNDRVNIEEDSYDTDTGYLLEWNMRQYDYTEGVEGVDWFKVYGIPFDIKSPKTDGIYYTTDQYNYIYEYILNVHLTLMNKRDYSSWIDVSTFVDWFIVNELFKNVDSGYSSVFYYKDKGGLLKMGPVWDFDLSSQNAGYLPEDQRSPEGWYTSLQYKNVWFYYLMQYDSFRQALKDRWNELYDNQIQDMLQSIYPVSDSIAKSRYQNFEKWQVIGVWYDWFTSPEVYNANTYEAQVKLLYDFLSQRAEWMNEAINDF